jgi:stress-induced-phosphoprotein 1
LELDPENAEAKDGIARTREAMYMDSGNEERAKHAMADPEIQAIWSDPIIRNVLKDFETNPTEAQRLVNSSLNLICRDTNFLAKLIGKHA